MDPIAVDVPAKTPLSLGLGSRPITTFNGASTPKPEARPEPAKPPFTPPAAPPAGPTTLPGKIANSLGFQPTRRSGLVLAAAACSLVGGIFAVKMIAPANKPNEATQPLVAEAAKPKEEPAKPATTATSGSAPSVAEVRGTESSPYMPLIPTAPGSTPPASPYVPPSSPYVPPTTPYVPPATPYVPQVIPVTLPSVPVIPATTPPSSTDGFIPAGTSKTAGSGVAIPQPVDLVPSLGPPNIYPASASEPAKPSAPPVPSVPVTLPSVPSIPPTTPGTLPSVPPTTPPSVVPPTSPNLLPSVPPSPPLTIDYTKTAGSTEVKPAPDRAAQTSFDVDLHEPKNGDTYAAICKEFYNEAKYAAALQEYNGRRPLQTSVRVEVPPIHVLKKRYPQLIGSVVPASGKAADGWAAAGETPTPAFRATGQRTFTVPAGGMTMGSIARDALGAPTRWRDIYDLNPQLSPGDVLPAGTVVKIPTDVKPNY